jgi:hypothetical protein
MDTGDLARSSILKIMTILLGTGLAKINPENRDFIPIYRLYDSQSQIRRLNQSVYVYM